MSHFLCHNDQLYLFILPRSHNRMYVHILHVLCQKIVRLFCMVTSILIIVTFLELFSRDERQWINLLGVTSYVKLLTKPSLKFILFKEIKEKYFKESLALLFPMIH